MSEADEQKIRAVVQQELLDIIGDAQKALGMKDPTGMAKRGLEGLANVIRKRQPGGGDKPQE
jgi:hypothetical protein